MAKSSKSKGGDLIRRIVERVRKVGGSVLGKTLGEIKKKLKLFDVNLQEFERAVQEMKRLKCGRLTKCPQGLRLVVSG